MDSAPGDPAYNELHAVKGQNIPVNFQYESLAAAKIDQTESVVIVKVTDALSAKGVSNAAAVTKTVASTCGFLLAQAHTDYVNNDNDDLWGMELAYETGNASLNGDQRWNGNITAMCWKSKTDNIKRGYGFRYDVLSRLTSAKYKAVNSGGFKWNFEVGHYDVPKIDYDQNGNITRLNRMGYVEVNGNPSFGAMDKLRYKYTGNQLRSVKDNATVSGYNDFRDNGATSNIDYTYDGNGNLTSDANKGYTASWNHLNLPEKVDFGGGKEILWLYDAAGTKLRKMVKESGQNDKMRDYVDVVVYQDGAMEFFFSPEGRVVRSNSNGNAFRYEHFYKDHLGNTRLGYSDLDNDGSIDPQTEVIQEEHYYPFGMSFAGIAKPQIGVEFGFKFNGKEIQEEFGLGLQDFGARMYDGQIGRWMGVDPLADHYFNYSPYNYVLGNPIKFTDPDGAAPQAGGEDKKKIAVQSLPNGATITYLNIDYRSKQHIHSKISRIWKSETGGVYEASGAHYEVKKALASRYFLSEQTFKSGKYDDGQENFIIGDQDVRIELELLISNVELTGGSVAEIEASAATEIATEKSSGSSASAGAEASGGGGSLSMGQSSEQSETDSETDEVSTSSSIKGFHLNFEAKVHFEGNVAIDGSTIDWSKKFSEANAGMIQFTIFVPKNAIGKKVFKDKSVVKNVVK
ncbi:MAG: RHS repeat-associated core domain-containing protein [Bacteroidota bacterium]